MYCIPLLRTYDELELYLSTVHKRDFPFPEQLMVNDNALFSNVV